MGWSGHKLPAEGWKLWTRGGTNGVFIQKESPSHEILSEEIDIPSELLRMLVADDVRSDIIDKLEQADTEKILSMLKS